MQVATGGVQCPHRTRVRSVWGRFVRCQPQDEPTAVETVLSRLECSSCLLQGSSKTASESPCLLHAASWNPEHNKSPSFTSDQSITVSIHGSWHHMEINK